MWSDVSTQYNGKLHTSLVPAQLDTQDIISSLEEHTLKL